MKKGISIKSFYYAKQAIALFCTLFLFQCSSPTHHQEAEKNNGQEVDRPIYYPSKDLGSLFYDVQMSGIFPDSKTFADCIPLYAPDSILSLYLIDKHDSVFDLKLFVHTYFQLPKVPIIKNSKHDTTGIVTHLNTIWNDLLRYPDTSTAISSLLPLSYPYIIPGGRFREVYYWDSYFTMEGLAASGRFENINEMLNNFRCQIDEFGYIPNGNRSYYLGRSQPPFYAEMIKLYMRETNQKEGLQYLDALEKEYQFWMDKSHSTDVENGVLNHYNGKHPEPRPESFREDVSNAMKLEEGQREDFYGNTRAACESGWDFSSRWLDADGSLLTIHTTHLLPVDLNCLLYNLENTLADLYQIRGNNKKYEVYQNKAIARKDLIIAYLWNQEKGFFYDYNWTEGKPSPIESLATVYPLFFKIATPEMADKIAHRLRKEFLMDGGLLTNLCHNGQQWDAPNGWAPLQWLAIVGLENYGHKGLADTIAQRWMALNRKVYRNTGKMMEKYNVSDTTLLAGGGEYPGQDGFGWTNGVYLGLYRKGYR
jgi:alpha,alpha-trehalase